MSKPNVTFTVKQMKDYIRQKKLNHPAIKLSMRRAELIEGLKKAGHWNSSKDPSPKKKPSKQPKELSWEKLKKMPKFINFLKKKHDGLFNVKKPEPYDFVSHDVLREMDLMYLLNRNKNLPTLYKDSIGKQSQKIQDEYYKRLEKDYRQSAFGFYEDFFKSRLKGSIPKMMKWIGEQKFPTYPIK